MAATGIALTRRSESDSCPFLGVRGPLLDLGVSLVYLYPSRVEFALALQVRFSHIYSVRSRMGRDMDQLLIDHKICEVLYHVQVGEENYRVSSQRKVARGYPI